MVRVPSGTAGEAVPGSRPLRVLIVEDSEDDALLLLRELRRGGYDPVYERVDAAGAMKAAFLHGQWDIVISDYMMPGFRGLAALEVMKKAGLDLPFIIVSGNIGEDIAVAAMRAGAHDYIIKGNLTRLVPAIERELREAGVRRERREAEAALRDSEIRYRSLFENSADAVIMATGDGKILSVNRAACDALQMTEEEIIRAGREGIVDMTDPAAIAFLEQMRRNGIARGTITCLRKGGVRFPCEVSSIVFTDRAGNAMTSTIARDITERRRSEDRVMRLSLLYLVLSRVNEAILRASEPRMLYEQVCRIVVEDGSFSMAWVGVADPTTMTVAPVASYGDDRGYLRDITIRFDDAPEAAGPTGRAVREQGSEICGDIQNDPSMLPWREKALRQGFRSLAAFHMRGGSGVSGAFTVYADKAQFFTDDEMNLLASMVENISFALEAMAHEKKRDEAEEKIVAMNEILTLFTQTFVRQEYLDRLVMLLSNWSGCANVGIRLINEYDEMPYVASAGFDQPFLEQERRLSMTADQCVCTRVINGRPGSPESPHISSGGSFFCSDVPGIFSSLAADPETGHRHACIENEYRAMAVVPIRYREKVLGAVHLAEKGEGILLRERIAFIESMTPLIGEAIYRFYIEEAFMVSRQQLRNLSSHLQSAREEERSRIAREIHDELGQLLTAASMALGRVKSRTHDQKVVGEAIASVSELIDNAVSDVQRICSELRPRVLDHLGLFAAIEWQAREFSKRSGVRCLLSLPRHKTRLPDDVSTSLFRIVQEALTNVSRHAKATEVSIGLRADAHEVVLEIKDNGKGIASKAVSGSRSFGIMGIHERVHALGGTVTFKGIRNKGTIIKVEVPLNGKGEKHA
ncbi:MAG: GAF domain-containing protein [Nitrospiraceae bacterium]|nr:GAF domain-containing protein [Nitrospiraceae bacterium]